jgi:hypothetical protein
MTGEFCPQCDFHGIVGIFYMPQIFTSPPKEGALRNIFALKNPTASAGFEPANLVLVVAYLKVSSL